MRIGVYSSAAVLCQAHEKKNVGDVCGVCLHCVWVCCHGYFVDASYRKDDSRGGRESELLVDLYHIHRAGHKSRITKSIIFGCVHLRDACYMYLMSQQIDFHRLRDIVLQAEIGGSSLGNVLERCDLLTGPLIFWVSICHWCSIFVSGDLHVKNSQQARLAAELRVISKPTPSLSISIPHHSHNTYTQHGATARPNSETGEAAQGSEMDQVALSRPPRRPTTGALVACTQHD